VAKQVIQKEGIYGIYRGMWAVMFNEVWGYATYFGIYEYLK